MIARVTDLTSHIGRLRHEAPTAVIHLDELPLMLTVAEAAAVLRISRTTAYKLAEEGRVTGGLCGLPTVKLGSRLLVRRVDLAAMVGLDATG